LANFVFTNHSVGCRERKKTGKKNKKKMKALIEKPECSKQRQGRKSSAFISSSRGEKQNQERKKGAGIYQKQGLGSAAIQSQ